MTERTYTTTATIPAPVAKFFGFLTEAAVKVEHQPYWMVARAYLRSDDLYALAEDVTRLRNNIATLTYQTVEIDRPTETDEPGIYLATVKTPEMVQRYFDILTGLSGVTYTPGDDHVTLTIEAEDDYDLARLISELENELAAELFDVTIPRPVLAK